MFRRLVGSSFLIFSLFFASPLAALEIDSITPAVAEAGTPVTITGGPFEEGIEVVLGGKRILPRLLGQRKLVFSAPSLEEGQYLLLLEKGEETSTGGTFLGIIQPAPVITALYPSIIDSCSTAEQRRVTVEGRHFRRGSRVLFAGSALAQSRNAEGSILFDAPLLASDTYGVEVVAPDGKKSLPHSIYINDLPEITGVRVGEEFVNQYQVIIEGKNFFYNSILVVNEHQVGFLGGLPPKQRVVRGQGGLTGTSGESGGPIGQQQAENTQYVDCRTLIYNRFPYSKQPKELSLRVINPDGKETSPYPVTLP